MKTLFEFAQVLSWEEVCEAMEALYPGIKGYKSAYYLVFSKILKMIPVTKDYRLVVEECMSAVEVGGLLIINSDMYVINEKDILLAYNNLFIFSWPELVGLKVTDLQMSRFGAAGMIAHLLILMTYYGFNQKKSDLVRLQYLRNVKREQLHKHIFKKRNYFVK